MGYKPKPWYERGLEGKPLTLRQEEVMDLVVLGKTNGEIGHILAMSPLTAKNHLTAIRRKLGASNRTLAVAKYLAPERFKKDE